MIAPKTKEALKLFHARSLNCFLNLGKHANAFLLRPNRLTAPT